MNNDVEAALSHMLSTLGRKRLNRGWAKAEILLGLGAVAVGVQLSPLAATPTSDSWMYAAAGLILFVLGGYLALAGHRSHLYQSNNELAAYLAKELRSLAPKSPPSKEVDP